MMEYQFQCDEQMNYFQKLMYSYEKKKNIRDEK